MTETLSPRRRVADAAVAAERVACIDSVDVLSPNSEPSDAWAISLVVATDQGGGVPWQVSQLLANHRLELLQADPQGLDQHEVLALG